MRGLEEVRLAMNLVRRGAELLNGVDSRALPGDPDDFRTRIRTMGYEAAIVVEGLEEALAQLSTE